MPRSGSVEIGAVELPSGRVHGSGRGFDAGGMRHIRTYYSLLNIPFGLGYRSMSTSSRDSEESRPSVSASGLRRNGLAEVRDLKRDDRYEFAAPSSSGSRWPDRSWL